MLEEPLQLLPGSEDATAGKKIQNFLELCKNRRCKKHACFVSSTVEFPLLESKLRLTLSAEVSLHLAASRLPVDGCHFGNLHVRHWLLMLLDKRLGFAAPSHLVLEKAPPRANSEGHL